MAGLDAIVFWADSSFFLWADGSLVWLGAGVISPAPDRPQDVVVQPAPAIASDLVTDIWYRQFQTTFRGGTEMLKFAGSFERAQDQGVQSTSASARSKLVTRAMTYSSP